MSGRRMTNRRKRQMQLLSRSILQQEHSSSAVMKFIILFLTAIIGFFLYWSTNVPLSEVVIARGRVQPLHDVALIQHVDGGEIEEIFVSERDVINAGDPLVRMNGEILALRIREGNSQLYSLRIQRNLLLEELDIQKQLHEQRLVSTIDYLSLQREIAEIRGRIDETMQSLERYELIRKGLIINAPISGTVHGLEVHGAGTIIKPGETIFSIIPMDAKYYAQIDIPASRMGAIKKGLPVVLKFSAYNFSRFGGMEGRLEDFSVATFLNDRGEPYYQGVVTLPRNYLGDNSAELPVLQGMTLNAEIQTGSKTLFEYLFLPVKSSTGSSFREP